MLSYLARRLLQSVFVLLIVSFVCFVVFQYLGDPIRANFGSQDVNQERAQELERMLGLDQPFYVQYGIWLYKVIGKPHWATDPAGNPAFPFVAFEQPDFGKSYRQRLPVMSLIMQRLPATLELATLALVVSTFLGVLLGMWSALRPRSLLAKSTMVTSLLGISIPTFVLGLLLIFLFSILPSPLWVFNIREWEPFVGWAWLPEYVQFLKPLAWWPKLPSFGRRGTVVIGGWQSSLFTFEGWSYMVLPMITLGFFQIGVMARLTRSGMFEALTQDYVRTAWAKGLAPLKVIGKHALRNVLIPVVTVLGLSYGELIAFSIVTESVFEWPGVGELLLTSVFQADQPMVVAYIFLAALVILMLNLAVDVAYLFLNPKIRYG